jgi:formamidopyrimidine-DNA glycosylase
VKLLKDKEAVQFELEKLGPEPLDPKYDWKTFKENLSHRPQQKIKTALMDQSLVVGIGNIYSDEMLWSSSIHPERIVASLSDADFKNLLRNGKGVLEKGIDFGGDSMSDYRNPYGLPGDFQKKHSAYRRTGGPCKKRGCDGTILRKVVGGRSAHFCSKHQTP